MKKWILGLILLFSLSSLPAFSATPPKPGSVCSKQGITKIYKGKKYTCIKSGKKLEWNKGVAVKTAAPQVSPTPNPASSPTATPPLPEKTPFVPTPTPTSKLDSLEGSTCGVSGNESKVDDFSYLECRFKKGKRLEWVKLSKIPSKKTENINTTDASKCKLKDASKVNYPFSGANGFPVIPTTPRTPKYGEMNLAILAVDFQEFPGELNIQQILKENSENLVNWFRYYSSGRLKVNVITSNGWVRANNPITFFDRELGHKDKTLDEAKRIITQRYVDLAPSNFDFSKIGYMFVLFPEKQNKINSYLAMGKDFSTRQGSQNFWVDPFTYNSAQRRQPPWALWIHELMHAIGISGHAPGNGWPFSIMSSSMGNSYALSAWDQFILEWLPDSQVYCVPHNEIREQAFTISPLEREDEAPKSVMIPFDEFRIIVIQTHGYENWVSREDPDTKMRKGFYGVMAYLVDTRLQNDRSNENVVGVSKSICEELYKDVRICGEVPSDKELDLGNDPRFPKFAYYIPIKGQRSHDWNWFTGYTPANSQIGDYIAVEGDEFEILGLNIKFVRTGDFNQILIKKS